MKGLGALSPEDRKTVGQRANEIKGELTAAFAGRQGALSSASLSGLAESERIDLSLPGLEPPTGHLHLTSQAIAEIEAIFSRLGFRRSIQPEVEWDWFTFESLNMPADHPARDNWETFFMDAPKHPRHGKMVLTPHTSSGQVREMQRGRRLFGCSASPSAIGGRWTLPMPRCSTSSRDCSSIRALPSPT